MSTAQVGDERVVRARAQVVGAVGVARRGRPASAERMLRDALGVFERRHRYAGAARAAATLSLVLRERGDISRARDVLRRAHVLFEAARAEGDPSSDEDDLAEARALLRSTIPVVAAPADARCAGSLAAFAADVSGLLQGGEPSDEAEPLLCVCAWLRTRLRARSVVIYLSGSPRRPVAVSGPADRFDPRMALGTTDGASAIPLGGGQGVGMATAIGGHDGPLGTLVTRWAKAPSSLEMSWTRALLRVGATACAADLRLTAAQASAAETTRAEGLLGESVEMQALRASICRVAAAPYPTVIAGESGVDKELVARALHRRGPRRRARFCAINCAALTDELFEAELFGHARGAFTGAVADRAGLFEGADRGTLFLDEVGELSARGQAKLLRVVQEGEIRRVGEGRLRPVDVRLIAATNRELGAEVAAGRFRQDLLFRLAVVRIAVPPLRQRAEDVDLLAKHFWSRALTQTGGRASLSAATVGALTRYDWPGNVRELQNVIAALAVCAPRRGVVGPTLLPAEIGYLDHSVRATLAAARCEFERRYARAAMLRAAGRITLAARELGLTRQGLAKLLKRVGAPGQSTSHL